MPKARKVILAIIIIFCVYAVLKYPTQSANTVTNFFNLVVDGLRAIGEFFNSLLT